MGFIYIFTNVSETEDEKRDKLNYDPTYIKKEVDKLKSIQSFLVE